MGFGIKFRDLDILNLTKTKAKLDWTQIETVLKVHSSQDTKVNKSKQKVRESKPTQIEPKAQKGTKLKVN